VTIALMATLFGGGLVAQQPPAVGGAQGPGRISGTVTGPDGQPLSAVAVGIRTATDSVLVTGVLTEKDGRFRIEGLPYGRYLLRVSLIGFKPRLSEVLDLNAEKQSFELGRIQLEVAPVQLDAVEASVEKSQIVVEPDRTIYNTAALPASSGTAVDVLRTVPELEVDVNNNVKLRGNQAVAVHLNGRPAPLRGEQLANFLQQLPGSRIERVEVMPNPSAKHDPEGMGGIVNIVLKENLDLGLSGSLSINAATRNQQYMSGRLNYQKGRLTLFSGVGVNRGGSDSWNYDYRRNLIVQPITAIEQTSRMDDNGRGWNLDWTAELKVGKQATLWTTAWGYWSDFGNEGVTEYGILNASDVVRDRYDRDIDNSMFWGNFDGGLGFKQIFVQQKEELTIDARWGHGDNDTDNRLRTLWLLSQGEPVDLPIELTLNEILANNGTMSIQADYFRPIAGGRVDIGYRAWKRTQDHESRLNIYAQEGDDTPREATRAGYDYGEVFHSLYVTTQRSFGKFGAQVGLRAELTGTDFDALVTSDQFDRDYNTLYPSVNLSYTPKPGRTVRLLYSKRISRPPASYLNPVVPSSDPLNISVGNPDLKPSYTQSFSADFSYTGSRGTIRIAPYYRRTTNIWERIRRVDSTGVAISRWENAALADNYGANFTISLRPMGKLSGATNFSIYRDERDGTNIGATYKRAAYMWSAGGNIGYRITETLTAQAFGHYFPMQSILQGRASGYGYTSIGLRQQLWGTKGSITLNINDPLNIQKFNSSSSDPTYIQRSRSSFSSRMASIGFTYNFGKPPQQQSRRQSDEGVAGETIRVR